MPNQIDKFSSYFLVTANIKIAMMGLSMVEYYCTIDRSHNKEQFLTFKLFHSNSSVSWISIQAPHNGFPHFTKCAASQYRSQVDLFWRDIPTGRISK